MPDLFASALAFPSIDPVLIAVGPLAIRWYSLAYIAGLLLGWWLIKRLIKRPPHVLTVQELDDLLIWVLFGVVLGGRVGYVLFYNAPYYVENPGDILKVWQGGMAFHGGMLGSIAAVYLFCLRRGKAFLPIMDLVALVAPIGLGLGRLANFVNGELFGRVTDAPWGMVFPRGGPLPRHPSQLYEAVSEGLILFVVLWLAMTMLKARFYPGFIGGLFLAGYGIARSTSELFREPDLHIGFLAGGVTMGQLLSIPMILIGCSLIYWARIRKSPLTA